MGRAMRAAFLFLAALVSGPALAEGPIETAERGRYVCELPGDAAGAAGVRQEHEDFRIRSASRYTSAQGDGVYLLRGDILRFTTGPRSGEAYVLVSRTFLRRLEPNGEPGRLRCVRTGR